MITGKYITLHVITIIYDKVQKINFLDNILELDIFIYITFGNSVFERMLYNDIIVCIYISFIIRSSIFKLCLGVAQNYHHNHLLLNNFKTHNNDKV